MAPADHRSLGGLVAATAVSFVLGNEGGVGPRTGASVVIILIAMGKVRLVGLYFMELRQAPRGLRLAFEGYVIALAGLLEGLLLWR